MKIKINNSFKQETKIGSIEREEFSKFYKKNITNKFDFDLTKTVHPNNEIDWELYVSAFILDGISTMTDETGNWEKMNMAASPIGIEIINKLKDSFTI